MYTVENSTSDIAVEEYIVEFRDKLHLLELCKRCANYGRGWGYPPFNFGAELFLRQYKYTRFMVTKIIPEDKNIPTEYTQKLTLPERVQIENKLLDMERKHGGRSFTYIGRCLHCSDNECIRNCGTPYRHPGKVRPSLEAFGFDITKTLSELFNIELLWEKDGKSLEYLVLVNGSFHSEHKLCNIAY